MPNLNEPKSAPKRWYRPEQQLCPTCRSVVKRLRILWHKRLIFLSGPEDVASWAYRCPDPTCAGADQIHCSVEAETVHLKYRHYSREVVVHIGYRRFWQHQTMYEIHEWLTQDLGLSISKCQVLNVIGDFLALLRAAQPAKVREQLKSLDRLVIGMDGMKPEKGNTCLYIVREAQLGLTLIAENLDDSVNTPLRDRLFEPLKALASELGLAWQGGGE